MSETSTDTEIPLHLSDATLDRFDGDDVVCLVDGEHYPPVTTATLDSLESNGVTVSGLVFLGGTEKIENPTAELATTGTTDAAQIYTGQAADGDVLDAIERAILEQDPSIVVDLSDEPVVTYEDRFEIASTTIALASRRQRRRRFGGSVTANRSTLEPPSR
ncbi:hypothetical protein [Natronorubrum bangense]|uniref:Cyclic 2,3-diphosphoglycerate synthetase n=1 Tax=Natronorubrum bangense JCM 10635 TaxID=1227500 RepID=L9WR09_9EURY|nr:hypothetical protein [Natronorubrum bangense]ELY51919.1 cyclic 2,3-diphosphoglycerate synthetase [Natronorubrum bangense JCM 10635]